jgi:hypothetical protein
MQPPLSEGGGTSRFAAARRETLLASISLPIGKTID